MQNRNALVSLAYASQNNDPYAVFQEYIKYCLHASPQDSLLFNELVELVQQEFGIKLPKTIANICVDKLKLEGLASVSDHKIYKQGYFDVSSFDAIRKDYRTTEATIIANLIRFAAEFDKQWDEEYAREMLTKALDRSGLAFDIFFMQNGKTTDVVNSVTEDYEYTCLDDSELASPSNEVPLYSDIFCAGQYVRKILEEDSIYKNYLVKICEGIVICAGVYQIPSSGSRTARPLIKNTTFFFDTRLLLRLVGCGSAILVESTQELVELIQKHGGKICYYNITKEEMLVAFDNAVMQLKQRHWISDFEMRCFAQKYKDNITVITAKKAALVQELASKGIYQRELQFDPETYDVQVGFSLSDLRQYMYNHVNWKDRVIDNDARVVWETHMSRKGDYSEYFGTNKRLSVFVTSNRLLMEMMSNYKKDRKETIGIRNWNSTRLPVITDARLMCRIWSPSEQMGDVPLHYMVSSVVAAQKFTPEYLKKICELATELKAAVPEYSNIPLSSYFDDNVTDEILVQTMNGRKELTAEQFASTMEELTSWKAQEEAALRKTAEEKVTEAQALLDTQRNQIVKDAVASYRKRIWFQEVCAWLSMHGTQILAILLAVIGTVIGMVLNQWWVVFPAISLVVIEKVLDACSSRWLAQKTLFRIEKRCKEKIRKNLRKTEACYENRITEEILSESRVLTQCHQLIQNK